MYGSFDPAHLQKYQELLEAKVLGQYDFTRCVRPNGTAYGTSGTCRLGVESDLPTPKKRGRPKKVRKPLAELSPEERKIEAERRIREIVRDLRKGDREDLLNTWVQEHNLGVWPKEFPSNLRMAKDIASKRIAGELKPLSKKEPEVSKELKPYVVKMDELYGKIRELKKLRLPSGEEDWRREIIDTDIYKVKKEALEAIDKLGSRKDKLKAELDLEELKQKATTWTPEKIADEISRFKYDIQAGSYSKDDIDKVKILINNFSSPSRRERELRSLGTLTGEVKLSDPGTLKGTLKASKSFLADYDEGLRSTVSILRKTEKLEQVLRAKLEEEENSELPGKLKRKIRLKKALFELGTRRGNAENRLNAKMEGIRNKLLETKLSDKEVESLVNKVPLLNPKTNKEYDPSDPEVQETRKQLREFVRMFNGKGVDDIKEGDRIRSGLSEFTLDPTKRAFAFPGGGQVTSNGNPFTFFHEVGHIVEGQRDWLLKYSNQWRDGRAFTQSQAEKNPESQKLVAGVPYVIRTLEGGKEAPVYRLAEMNPLRNRGYTPNEVAVVDTYLSPYLGKVYDDKLTEVASSTFEHFASAKGMTILYKKHPELFELGVGLAVD